MLLMSIDIGNKYANVIKDLKIKNYPGNFMILTEYYNLATRGIRRPLPKAFVLTLNTGGD